MDENKEKMDGLHTQLAKLKEDRDKAQNGNKKAALAKKIKALEEEITALEDASEDKDGKIKIFARSTTGRESYRRAGLRFTSEMGSYGVTEEQLAALDADPNIKLERKDSNAEE